MDSPDCPPWKGGPLPKKAYRADHSHPVKEEKRHLGRGISRPSSPTSALRRNLNESVPENFSSGLLLLPCPAARMPRKLFPWDWLCGKTRALCVTALGCLLHRVAQPEVLGTVAISPFPPPTLRRDPPNIRLHDVDTQCSSPGPWCEAALMKSAPLVFLPVRERQSCWKAIDPEGKPTQQGGGSKGCHIVGPPK